MVAVESPGLPLHDKEGWSFFLRAYPARHTCNLTLLFFCRERFEVVTRVNVRDFSVSEPFEVCNHVLISTQANMVPCVIFLDNPQGKDRVEGWKSREPDSNTMKMRSGSFFFASRLGWPHTCTPTVTVLVFEGWTMFQEDNS